MWKERLLSHPLVWVNGGALVAGWIFGAYHAWQEHSSNTALLAILLPPYGAYMAVEYARKHKHEVDSIMKDTGDGVSRAQACRDDTATFLKSGLSREQYEIWCDCSAPMIAAAVTAEEIAYNQAQHRSSPGFKQQIKRAQQSCYSTVKYLGMPLDEEQGGSTGPE